MSIYDEALQRKSQKIEKWKIWARYIWYDFFENLWENPAFADMTPEGKQRLEPAVALVSELIGELGIAHLPIDAETVATVAKFVGKPEIIQRLREIHLTLYAEVPFTEVLDQLSYFLGQHFGIQVYQPNQ